MFITIHSSLFQQKTNVLKTVLIKINGSAFPEVFILTGGLLLAVLGIAVQMCFWLAVLWKGDNHSFSELVFTLF